ncbi:PTPA-CTERM sorting domain-containing protein [Marinihelvus fidelis]|uniref:PTPA-CTERM sorting domain-containing protein n=1 Tax=Marinihelvus fidelis TaxID=2613842 RepID=A0A5N0TCZ0_9GAMM|nr:PTPA-CTERM sorting domain-containing protein [Marinihelvus fidelis]
MPGAQAVTVPAVLPGLSGFAAEASR